MKKRITRSAIALLTLVATSLMLSSCYNSRMYMWEDDEWSIMGIDSDHMLINSELEMDDYDR